MAARGRICAFFVIWKAFCARCGRALFLCLVEVCVVVEIAVLRGGKSLVIAKIVDQLLLAVEIQPPRDGAQRIGGGQQLAADELQPLAGDILLQRETVGRLEQRAQIIGMIARVCGRVGGGQAAGAVDADPLGGLVGGAGGALLPLGFAL